MPQNKYATWPWYNTIISQEKYKGSQKCPFYFPGPTVSKQPLQNYLFSKFDTNLKLISSVKISSKNIIKGVYVWGTVCGWGVWVCVGGGGGWVCLGVVCASFCFVCFEFLGRFCIWSTIIHYNKILFKLNQQLDGVSHLQKYCQRSLSYGCLITWYL